MVMVASNHAAVDCDTVLCHMITENVNKTLNKVELNGLFFSFHSQNYGLGPGV